MTGAPASLRNLFQKIQTANARHRLFKKGEAIVVGFSGGPDSTALLWVLSKLRRTWRLKLSAAHLDHGLNKTRSRHFVSASKALCQTLNIPLFIKKMDVKALAKKERRSLEDAGRQARYRFFMEAARRTRSAKIATAHTMDDQAETVLMHLLRGAGLRGLSGIPPRRRHGRFEVIRPFLYTPKKDILDFLKKSRIAYARDPMNADTLFTRSRIRRRLLPYLERHFNPRVRERLAKLATVCYNSFIYKEGR